MHADGSNYSRVFHALYDARRISKRLLAKRLALSLPTISSCLRTLEREGFVAKRGSYDSTGGRPATAYEFVTGARCAIGIELAAEYVRVAAVDLYGNVLAQHDEQVRFERTDAYLRELGALVNKIVAGCVGPRQQLLGVSVAIQGIVGDANRVSFGGLLGADSAQVSLDDFAGKISGPLRLVHDAETAAFAELWRHRELHDFVYLSLNDHLGSAVVHRGALLHGGALGAGVAEHLVLRPGGRECYCGGRGCAETLLGARSLEERAGTNVETFFEMLRAGDNKSARIWNGYLSDLALLVHNVRMINCGDLMLGGRLARHMREADLRVLKSYASQYGALARAPFRLLKGQYGDAATVVGAGLLLVDEFLASV